MSLEMRRYTRIYHKDLKDYKLVLEKKGSSFKGDLGNISEGGFCVILPKNTQLERGEIVQGYLYYIHEAEKYPFEGKIAWVSDYEHAGKIHLMAGIEFTTLLNLPERLLALAMSLD